MSKKEKYHGYFNNIRKGYNASVPWGLPELNNIGMNRWVQKIKRISPDILWSTERIFKEIKDGYINGLLDGKNYGQMYLPFPDMLLRRMNLMLGQLNTYVDRIYDGRTNPNIMMEFEGVGFCWGAINQMEVFAHGDTTLIDKESAFYIEDPEPEPDPGPGPGPSPGPEPDPEPTPLPSWNNWHIPLLIGIGVIISGILISRKGF
jgi:hypothetical protein